jgi:YD repeat-containing protein
MKDYWSYVHLAIGDHLLSVNLSNGNLLISHVDQNIPAPGIDSFLLRSYNSLNPSPGDFGHGWTSNVGNTLRLVSREDGSMVFIGTSGAVAVLELQDVGFVSPPGFHYTLRRETDGAYTLTNIAGGVSLNFDTHGQLTSVSDRNGNPQSYRRDDDGNVVEITDSVGQNTAIAYDETGVITGITDRAGRVSQYRYDSEGRLTHYADPASHTTEYHYSAGDNLTELIDAGGQAWAFSYDALGRVIRIMDPLGDATEFTYQDGTTKVTDANGHDTVYRLDDAGKLQERIDPSGHSTRFTWDAFYNLTSIASPLNHETRLDWDGNTGLLTSVSDPLGNTLFYTYDDNHNPTMVTDARGSVTYFAYDPAGANLLRVTWADGGETTLIYNSQGNPITMVDPSGNASDPSNPTGIPYRFAYNAYGYLTDAYDPLGNHWRYTWNDATGNLLSILDAKGQLTQYTYDELDRLTSITYGDGTTDGFTYDALGNLLTMTDGQGTTTYTYDAVGQLRTEDSPRTRGVIQYDYDPVGDLIHVTRENGDVLDFDYDPAGRLISQSNPFDKGKLITYGYDADDRLVEIIYPNGDRTTYTYYPNDWLESVLTTASDGTVYNQYDFPSQTDGGYDANGNPLEFTRAFAFFDDNGNLDQVVETWKVRYDAMERLVQLDIYDTKGAWQRQVTLSYNPNGLWASRTYEDDEQSQSWEYSYDAASRWVGISFWDGRRDVVVNDANGNQAQIIEEFFTSTGSIIATTTTFEYDAADRLTKVTDSLGNWYTFEYDGFDRMIEVDSSWFTSPTRQYYDLLGMERETQGSATVYYLYDLAGAVRANAVEGFPAQYLHRDPRGQITHISDELLQSVDYCFMGNVQGSSTSDVPVYEPLLSTSLYVIRLQGTWEAGILYLHKGQVWPHNSQLDTQNIPAIPPMRNRPPNEPPIGGGGGGGYQGFDDGDFDNGDPKDPWWRRLFKRLKDFFKKAWRWIRTPGRYNPWLGKWFEPHLPHHGQGPHSEAIIRGRGGRNFIIIYPSKKWGWWWPYFGYK